MRWDGRDKITHTILSKQTIKNFEEEIWIDYLIYKFIQIIQFFGEKIFYSIFLKKRREYFQSKFTRIRCTVGNSACTSTATSKGNKTSAPRNSFLPDLIWCDEMWYDMILYDMIWCDVILYDMMWHDMIMIWYDISFHMM